MPGAPFLRGIIAKKWEITTARFFVLHPGAGRQNSFVY